MITNFKIDQVATFPHGVTYLACEPKFKRGSQDQDRTASGRLKWEVHLLVGMRNQFGALGFETLKVGISSESAQSPCEGLAPQTPVHLIDFEIGVMERTKRDPNTGAESITGVTVWYRAGEIRSTAEVGRNSKAA